MQHGSPAITALALFYRVSVYIILATASHRLYQGDVLAHKYQEVGVMEASLQSVHYV